jgi:hypothetical protein
MNMANQDNFNRQYKPIDGDFYDEIEAAATLGQNCEITYRDEAGTEQQIISPIKDLFTENGVEFARLENLIIPLNSITSLNGKTAAGGQIHTELLEQDRMPADEPYISPADGLPPHEGSTGQYSYIPNTDVKPDTHDNIFKGDVGKIGKTGIPSADNGLIEPVGHGSSATVQPGGTSNTSVNSGTVHQSEVVKENFLGMPSTTHQLDTHNAAIVETPDHLKEDTQHTIIVDTPDHHIHQQAPKADFVHGFTTSVNPFIVADNDMYLLTAHRKINRLDLVVRQDWYSLSENQELGVYIARIVPLMGMDFTMLIDLTALRPDEDGTIMSPAIANKNILFNAGLAKVAELVPYECDTLVHGQDSISVNSVRLRYFKDRLQAENWLNDDPAQIGTPDDMDLN